VQSDHFEEFFSPELEKHGYAAVYKKKTAEVTPLLLNRKFSELVRRTSICLVNS
jgi:mRNA deadenylase 3'-5' endonuclease subunit Ccr4